LGDSASPRRRFVFAGVAGRLEQIGGLVFASSLLRLCRRGPRRLHMYLLGVMEQLLEHGTKWQQFQIFLLSSAVYYELDANYTILGQEKIENISLFHTK